MQEINIVDFIPKGKINAITRKELVALTGMRDRQVREAISQERRKTVILNDQDGNGYFIPSEYEKDLVLKFIDQETKRGKSIFWSLKAARDMVRDKA